MSPDPINIRAVVQAVRMARRDVSPTFDDDAMGDEHRDELVYGLPRWVSDRRGWVYLARNVSWPGLLKIGCTRKGVPERMQSLSGTSVLTPWQPQTIWSVYDAHGLEAASHTACAHWHRRAELFEAPQHEVEQAIRRAMLADKALLLKHLHEILLPGELHSLLNVEQLSSASDATRPRSLSYT